MNKCGIYNVYALLNVSSRLLFKTFQTCLKFWTGVPKTNIKLPSGCRDVQPCFIPVPICNIKYYRLFQQFLLNFNLDFSKRCNELQNIPEFCQNIHICNDLTIFICSKYRYTAFMLIFIFVYYYYILSSNIPNIFIMKSPNTFTFYIFGLKCRFHPWRPCFRYPRWHYRKAEGLFNEKRCM